MPLSVPFQLCDGRIMKKLLASLIAIAFAFGSISAFAADQPAKDNTGMQKSDKKPTKKARKSSKKSSAKAEKKEASTAAPTK